jgi:CBS domain-containing protein
MTQLLHELVRDVMTPNPIMLLESATVQTAAVAMREADVGDVVVMRGEEVSGILTDRDIVVRYVADGGDPAAVAIGEICSPAVTEVETDDPLDDAIELMRGNAIRRLVVMNRQRPVGIVSLGDLALARDPHSVLADISASPPNG